MVAAIRTGGDTAGWTPIFGSASAAGMSEGVDGPVARTNRAGIGLDADPDVNNDDADALATDLEHTRLMRRTAGFAPPDLADAVPDIASGIDDSVLPAAPDDDAPVPQATATLTVDLSGSGSGGVTSSPAGVSCGGSQTSCSAAFATGTSVTLTATPTGGHTFLGWSGACTGTGGCVVSLTGDRLVVATFHQPVTPVVTFYHLDPIGSVRARTDASGTVLARHDYFPFGEDTQLMTGDPNRFGGQELDPESGQHYFHARQYRNIWGRFTTVDPGHLGGSLTDPQGWNAYAYALNNPLRFVDPTGLAAFDFSGFCRGTVDDKNPNRVGVECDWEAINRALWFLDELDRDEWRRRLDLLQNGMDALSIAADGTGAGAAVGWIPDILNAGISALRGNWAGAMASLGSAPPFIGVSGNVANIVARSLGANPFKGKTAQEIADRLTAKGYLPRGPDPVAGKGTFVNPMTRRSYHIDASHPAPKGPHVGVHRPRDLRGVLDPRDYPLR